jgi:ribosomal protein S8
VRQRPAEFEIELKYFDGDAGDPGASTACRSRAAASTRRSTRCRRVCNGLGVCHPLDAEGRRCRTADARAQNVGGEVLCTVF